MHCRPLPRTAVATLALLLAPHAVHTDATRLVANGDAYVDAGDNETWTIGNPGITFTLSLTRARALVALSLSAPDPGAEWLPGGNDAAAITINGAAHALDAQAFQFDGVTASPRGSGVELAARFHSSELHVDVEQHYACYAGAPVIEAWIKVSPLDGRGVTLGQFPGMDLLVRRGRVRWITGLQTPPEDGGSFTLTSTDLDDGASLQLGSPGRASERDVPWFQVLTSDGALFGGILWQGAWQLAIDRRGDALQTSIGLPPFLTTIDTPVETPHAYVGLSDTTTRRASEAMRAFVMASVRQGRPYVPLVTYNTWFSYGTAIDEVSMREEIESAADLGIELFVIDAGWYPSGTDPSDFTTGIGVWDADPKRFPSGLAALSDLAHQRGMKFGIWVEPERVDLATVGRTGLARERWLATVDGRYDPSQPNATAPAAQICLASADARAWIVQRMTHLIDQAHPDYLKWDNNMWVNCNRPGHGHGSEDGNYAHNVALQQILAELRARYPDLLIENCSGGGNRLEPGMLAWTDTAWMDDRTFTAPHVRHNLEGLSVVMPPPVLLSFVFGAEWQDPAGGIDLTTSFRSRMPGMLGATWRGRDLSDDDRAGIQREIQVYKDIRETLSDASATLLTPQLAEDQQGRWDVLQETAFATGFSVVFAYQSAGGADHITVRPQGLRPDVLYDIVSVDTGAAGRVSGADLASKGIGIEASDSARAHILELRPVADVAASARR